MEGGILHYFHDIDQFMKVMFNLRGLPEKNGSPLIILFQIILFDYSAIDLLHKEQLAQSAGLQCIPGRKKGSMVNPQDFM